jgi:hypothetical protein
MVGLVGAEFAGAPAAWSAPRPHGRNGSDQWLEGKTVVGVGPGYSDRHRQAPGFGQDVRLAAGFAAVDRVGAGQCPPFSPVPRRRRRSRKSSPARRAHRVRPVPLGATAATGPLLSRRSRRCAVAGETPSVGGRCRHAHPLVRTYTTAVNTARSSSGAVPPPCGRGANDGSNGATSSHNPSGTSRCDRSAPTNSNHAAARPSTT